MRVRVTVAPSRRPRKARMHVREARHVISTYIYMHICMHIYMHMREARHVISACHRPATALPWHGMPVPCTLHPPCHGMVCHNVSCEMTSRDTSSPATAHQRLSAARLGATPSELDLKRPDSAGPCAMPPEPCIAPTPWPLRHGPCAMAPAPWPLRWPLIRAARLIAVCVGGVPTQVSDCQGGHCQQLRAAE